MSTSLQFQNYSKTKVFSDNKLFELRNALNSLVPSDCAVITNGSYARREACEGSDIDYIIVSHGGNDTTLDFCALKEAISSIVPIDPADGGAFASSVTFQEFLTNVGGMKDNNGNLTRRLLLLLEGEWLAGENIFHDLRLSLIKNYVDATPKSHQLALFLLNDIVRYWRTMTVDYAFKTSEESKPWGIRNIKLSFSRKLMYASGLFAVAMTADRTSNDKVDFLIEKINFTAFERLNELCGIQARPVLQAYDDFLGEICRPEVRLHLKELAPNARDDELFRRLKNESHRFTQELMKLFDLTFSGIHPIRKSILF